MYILYERKHPYELMTIYKIIFTTFETFCYELFI